MKVSVLRLVGCMLGFHGPRRWLYFTAGGRKLRSPRPGGDVQCLLCGKVRDVRF
jgi:hypothetical protein